MSENNLPVLLNPANTQEIAIAAPATYQKNATSSQACIAFGEKLLAEIQRAGGMTDALDKQCADYVDKTKRTLKAMNKERAPFTKLFDQIRGEFTAMENSIDPAKNDTVPYKVQQLRNAYAAAKREEMERQRREAERRQAHDNALARYRQDAEDDYRRQFDQKITADINALTGINQSLTLVGFDEVSAQIKNFPATLTNDWFKALPTYAHRPMEITDDEALTVRKETLNRLSKQFKEQYAAEVGEYRDSLTDALPSKRRELERIVMAKAEEQEKMKAELAAKEAAATRALDEERRRKEAEAAAAKQVQKQANEANSLFGAAQAAAPAGYQPKTSVRLRVVAETPAAVLALLSMWWSKEGQYLPVEDLLKTFRKQITFCEKLANDKDHPEFAEALGLRYEEEVKAK